MIGLGLLCVAVPVLRDLLVRQRPGAGAGIAAVAYTGLLVTMRIAGISAGEAGIRSITWRSLLLGILAAILVVAPVWRLPSISAASAGWLLLAVIVEEVAFRGVLFAILRQVGGLPMAIGGSTVVFMLAHLGSAGWPGLLLVGLAGLYFGALRALRGDLWPAAIAHFLMDLVSLP